MAELSVPQIDFSGIGQLPQVYKQAQSDALRQQTLANLGQGTVADSNALLRSGDMSLAQLGLSLRNRQEDQARQAQLDARQLAQDAEHRREWQASFGLQQRQADRADQTPLDKANERAAAATKFGIDPNSPEGRNYVITGQLPTTIADTATQRAGIAKQYGIDPATPEGKAFVLTGKLPDTTPEAGFELNPDFGKVEGAPKLRPISGGSTDPNTIALQTKAKADAKAEDVPQATIDFLADRVRMGDPLVKVGYARNPGMIAKIDSAAQQREQAGIPVSEEAKSVVGNKVTLGARNSAEHRLGTINTNNEFYGHNALGAMDIAEKASADVPRTNYPKVNDALNAYRTNTGDPKTVALGGAINTVINDYAKFAGGGTPTDALRGEAYKMLNTAHSHEQVQGILNMMRTEINRGMKSPGMVREGFDALYAPHGTGGGASTAPPTKTATPVKIGGYTITEH